MFRKIVSIAVGLTACMLLSAAALTAQTDSYKSPTDTSKSRMGVKAASSGKMSASDERFMKKEAAGGIEEVELGKLAADKASDPDVKKFGQRMSDDHSKANDELTKLAQQKGVDVPSALDAKGQRDKDRLSKLSEDHPHVLTTC